MALISRKAQASIIAALLFFVISSPLTYRLVDSLIGGLMMTIIPSFAHLFKIAQAGCPTTYGLFIHAFVFGVVTYILMHTG
jgi:hypothetical protein